MKFFILSTTLLLIGVQCGYPVAQNSYPTPPPPSDSYVVPKQSYPTAPGAYATKHSFPQNSAPVTAPPLPPPPAPSGYSSDDASVTSNVAASPPAPPTDAQIVGSSSSSTNYGGSSPTYGGSLSSGGIVGGNSLNYGTYNSASAGTPAATGAGASSGCEFFRCNLNN